MDLRSTNSASLVLGPRNLPWSFDLLRRPAEETRQQIDLDMVHEINPRPEFIEQVQPRKNFVRRLLYRRFNDLTAEELETKNSMKCARIPSDFDTPATMLHIKIGSYRKHVLEYASVHRPLVKMVLFAHTLYGDTLECVKKSIVDLYESDCISATPKTQSNNSGSACKDVHDLTDAEPENHGALDSAGRRIIKADDRTAPTWLIDTGAVHHATGKLALLSGVTDVNDDVFITARDGARMQVRARGSVITDTVVLPDVWYIPGLTKNVVSAGQLTELDYSVGFSRGTCFIRNDTDGTVIGKGRVSQDGLFEMDFLKVPHVI